MGVLWGGVLSSWVMENHHGNRPWWQSSQYAACFLCCCHRHPPQVGVGFMCTSKRMWGVFLLQDLCGLRVYLTEKQKRSPPPPLGGGCRPKSYCCCRCEPPGGWLGCISQSEACMCVVYGVCLARKSSITTMCRRRPPLETQTTTVGWWLPPPAAVSGGGVLVLLAKPLIKVLENTCFCVGNSYRKWLAVEGRVFGQVQPQNKILGSMKPISRLTQPIQPVLTTSTTTSTTTVEPDLDQAKTTFEVGSSEHVSPTRYGHDIASERLSRFLAENEADLPSRGKGISIEEGNLKGDDSSNPELKEEITVLKQQILTTSTTTSTTTVEPDLDQAKTTFEVGSSEHVSPTRYGHDIASERLSRFLAENEADLPSRGKGISIEEGNLKGDDSSNPELKEEITVLKQQIIEKDLQIEDLDACLSVLEAESSLKTDQISALQQENAQKSKQMSDLQINLGALSASYFDLKNRLIADFGDKFQSTVEGPSVSQAPTTAPATTPTFEQTDNVSIKTTTVIDRFEKEPTQAPPRITIKRGGRTVTSQKRGGLLFMKNYDQNIRGDQPQLTVYSRKHVYDQPTPIYRVCQIRVRLLTNQRVFIVYNPRVYQTFI
ncbi:unnamed protein product [Lactuca saligna]|uniref:Kinesin-like protein n=1 Tax=Lactuca saligna TaxID=75948 RepID=A0AA35ZU00_LACSI|nr:unnamed protein product [Lactuca saligna]